MKTTVEIQDALYERARAAAREEGRTFRKLLEEALQQHLQARGNRPVFQLKNRSVGGRGLHEAAQNQGGYTALRDLAYPATRQRVHAMQRNIPGQENKTSVTEIALVKPAAPQTTHDCG